MAAVSFSTVVQPDPDPGDVLLIEVPARVVAALSDKKRVPVNVTLNGVRYRSTIAVYGGKFYLPARKDIRATVAASAVDASPHLGKARKFRSASHCVAWLSFATPDGVRRRSGATASHRIASLPSTASLERRTAA